MDNINLWNEYKKNPKEELKKKIILQYSNLVHYVIHNSKLNVFNDLIDERDYFQFGIEGLSEAIDRFDPEFGTKFETYAIQRIRGKIIDELRKIKIKSKVNDVQLKTIFLDESLNSDDNATYHEVIPSNAENPEEVYGHSETKEMILEALNKLNERERLVIILYYYEDLNYKEIAKLLHITVSRVSQIHSKVMEELKNNLMMYHE